MTVDVKGLPVLERQMRAVPTELTRGIRSAISKMGSQTQTLTRRILSLSTGLTQTKLRPYVRLRPPTYSKLEAGISVIPHVFNIASFPGSRQTKRGVSSLAWGKRKVYPHTFLINGGLTAMVRVSKARYPIRPVYGPRLHAMFAKDETIDPLTANVQAKMPDLMKHEIDYALSRAGLKLE